MDTSLIDTIEIYPIIRTRAIAHINSDYNQNINHQHSTPQGKKLVQTTVTGDKTKIFLTPLQPELVYSPLPTQFHRSRIALLKDIRQATGSDVSERLDNLLKPLNSSDNNNGSGDGNPSLQTKEKENANFFQTEFGNPENLAIESEQEEKSNTSKIP